MIGRGRSGTMTRDDFEDELRAMLRRRAADIEPGPTTEDDAGDTRWPGLDRFEPIPDVELLAAGRRLRFLAVAAAVLVVAGLVGGVVLLAGGRIATDPAESNDPTVEDSPERSADGIGGTDEPPTPEQLPPGIFESDEVVFTGVGGPEAVVLAYLDDRLPDRTEMGLTLARLRTISTTSTAVFRWRWGHIGPDAGREGAAGWIYLTQRPIGTWSVVAATTDGVDTSGLTLTDGRLVGPVLIAGEDLVAVDLIDPEADRPFDPETGVLVTDGGGGTDPGRFVGTAFMSEGGAAASPRLDLDLRAERRRVGVRIREMGGTILSITEFVLTQPWPEGIQPFSSHDEASRQLGELGPLVPAPETLGPSPGAFDLLQFRSPVSLAGAPDSGVPCQSELELIMPRGLIADYRAQFGQERALLIVAAGSEAAVSRFDELWRNLEGCDDFGHAPTVATPVEWAEPASTAERYVIDRGDAPIDVIVVRRAELFFYLHLVRAEQDPIDLDGLVQGLFATYDRS